MPGILNPHILADRMDAFCRAHPDVKIYAPSEDILWHPERAIWRAVIPLGGTYERFLARRSPKALLDKLDRAMGER